MFSGWDVRLWYFVIIIYNYVVYVLLALEELEVWYFYLYVFKCLMNYREFVVCSFVLCRFCDTCNLTCNRAPFLLQNMSLISHQWDNKVVLNLESCILIDSNNNINNNNINNNNNKLILTDRQALGALQKCTHICI